MIKHLLLVIVLAGVVSTSTAQDKKSRKEIFRDTLDGAFDMSDFLLEAHGFVPVPFIITEPAFGGFGGGVAPVFLKKRPPMIDTVRSKLKIVPTPPDMTGGALIYTANQSWIVMAFRSATWMKARSKYRIAGGYADLNLSFYRTSLNGEENEFEFNFKTIPLFGYLMKDFRGTSWSAGIQYIFLNTELEPVAGELPDFVKDTKVKSRMSMPGVIVEFDNRDNIFTPDKGLRFHASLSWSNKTFGSDYDYENLNVFGYAYHPISKKVIGGLRYEMQQVFGDTPFYLLPYLDLRGLPVARYQGNIFSVAEAEVRWDFVPRWSVVAFAGSGKTYDEWSDFSESDWISSGGAGFRYLTARKFKLRMGLDVARGPEQWTYYIVFGSAWMR